MEASGFIFGIIFFVVFLFLIRLFGAWMLRIDEVINQLESINAKLKKMEKKDKK